LFLFFVSLLQWRKSGKWSLSGGGDGEEEEEEGEDEEGEGDGAKEAAPEYNGPDRVVIESFTEGLLEDEFVNSLFNADVEVPKVDKPEGDDDEDEDEEED